MNCQNFSPKIHKFPPGIFEVTDSREFPNGNSRWPCFRDRAACCFKIATPPVFGAPVGGETVRFINEIYAAMTQFRLVVRLI